ncbi:MAG: TlpA family protein disulfide reductase [Opitutaceae bacterium]
MTIKPLLVLGFASAALAFGPMASASEVAPQRASPWQLKDPSGHQWSSADFKGKIVLLDFWATWCPPCVKEIPSFVALQDKYRGEGLAIVGVSIDEAGPGTVRRFLEKHPVNYPVVLGSWGFASGFLVHDQIPTTVIVDRAGFIRDVVVGYESRERLEKRLLAYLRPSS